MHYIYKITDTLNNKIYIGQSKEHTGRWKQHMYFAKHPEKTGQYIHRAMNKYGVENFTYEIIDFAQNQWQADCIEDNLIALHNSRNKEYGYNLMRGGNLTSGKDHPSYGKKQSAEIIEQRLASSAWFFEQMKGNHTSPETEFKKGHTFTPEMLQKMSQAKIGKPTWNAGTKGKGVMKANKASFQPGHPAPKTAFQKGLVPWNKKLDHEEIIVLKNNGVSAKELATRFGCAEGTIYSIVRANKS